MNPYSKEYGLALGRKITAWCERDGIVPVPDKNAPTTYDALRRWWDGEVGSAFSETNAPIPFPVFSGGCETSIYGSPEANHAFRAMHDYMHIQEGMEFDLYGEIRTALVQERVLGVLSAEEQLTFRIDSIGQSLLSFLDGGRHLHDQEVFVMWVYREFNLISENIDPKLGENYMQILQRAVYSYHIITQ